MIQTKRASSEKRKVRSFIPNSRSKAEQSNKKNKINCIQRKMNKQIS